MPLTLRDESYKRRLYLKLRTQIENWLMIIMKIMITITIIIVSLMRRTRMILIKMITIMMIIRFPLLNIFMCVS